MGTFWHFNVIAASFECAVVEVQELGMSSGQSSETPSPQCPQCTRHFRNLQISVCGCVQTDHNYHVVMCSEAKLTIYTWRILGASVQKYQLAEWSSPSGSIFRMASKSCLSWEFEVIALGLFECPSNIFPSQDIQRLHVTTLKMPFTRSTI